MPVAVVLILLYFLPSIVGLCRRHHQIGPIIVIDLFLGWTMIGWVIALAMAASAVPTGASGARRSPPLQEDRKRRAD